MGTTKTRKIIAQIVVITIFALSFIMYALTLTKTMTLELMFGSLGGMMLVLWYGNLILHLMQEWNIKEVK